MKNKSAIQGSKVLIVDDDEYNVDVLVQSLGDQGFETETAYGGKDALSKVASSPPDIILLDVMMPDLDGITVCRMLKDDPETQLIPIVIMTALNSTEDRVRGIEAGADDFLSKPIEERELFARVKTALQTKKAVDLTIDELRSAEAQLERMGTHTEDLTLLAIELITTGEGKNKIPSEAKMFLFDRYLAAITDVLTMFSGEVIISKGRGLLAMIRVQKSEQHPQLAIEASLAIIAEIYALNQNNSVATVELKIVIDSGLAKIGSTRTEQKGGNIWRLSVTGTPKENIVTLLENAAFGEILTTKETISRTEDRFAVKNSRGFVQILGLKDIRDEILFNEQDTQLEDLQKSPSQTSRGSLPWPAEYASLESRIFSEWGVEDVYLIRVLSGKSGALVYAVDITTSSYSGQAILKLSEVSDPSREEEDEATLHRSAEKNNPDYAKEHLPEIVDTLENEKQMAILATIAAGGLEYAVPWAHSDYEVQQEAASQLSMGILQEWNNAYKIGKGLIDPPKLLTAWLSYRLFPNRRGRIHDLLSRHGKINPEINTFYFEGQWYPNPLAFALGVVNLPENLSLRTIAGNIHGDLHGNNVLVGRENGDIKYHLIDLAFYKPDAYLFFDHAYFELSHLLHRREKTSLKNWIKIISALEHSSSPNADDIGLINLLSVVREEAQVWIKRYEPNRMSYLDSQYMLARVAAGLNFSHKRISLEGKLRSFLYAAECLKTYLKFHNFDWPKQGEIFDVSG